MVDPHSRNSLVSHGDDDVAVAFQPPCGYVGFTLLQRLAVERHGADAAAVAADCHIERRASVTDAGEGACVGKSLGDEWAQRDAVRFEVDAHEQAHGQGDVAGERPQHVGGVEFGVYVAVVEVEILLVGSKQGCRTHHCPYRLERALLVAGSSVGESPVRADERPQRVVVVAGHIGYLREEYRRAEGRDGVMLRYGACLTWRGDAVKDSKRRTEGLVARVGNHVVAAVSVHEVIPHRAVPEAGVDSLGNVIGTLGVFAGLPLFAEHRRHLRHDTHGGCVKHVRPHGLRPRNVCRLHPLGIALLAPVDERRLASHKPRPRHRLAVFRQRAARYRVYGLEPRPVAGDFVDLPCGKHPHQPVGGYGPCAAAAGVLYDLPLLAHLSHQRYARGLGLQRCHGEDDGVAHVACPHARPFLASTQRGVRLNGVDHLVKAHVENGLEKVVGGLEPRICRQVVFAPPALLNGHEVAGTRMIRGLDFLRGNRPSAVFALDYGVAAPLVGFGGNYRRCRCCGSCYHQACQHIR